MKTIFIALGVVVFLWLVSLIIHAVDRASREAMIKEKKAKKQEKNDTPPWQSSS